MGRTLVLLLSCVMIPALGAETADPLSTYEGLQAAIAKKVPNLMVLDVREYKDYKEGHIPTAVNIPLNNLIYQPPTKNLNMTIVVYCRFGNLSGRAVTILESLGFKKVVYFGRISGWKGERVK